MDDELDTFLAAVPDLVEVIPVAQVGSAVAGRRFLTTVEVMTTCVIVRYLDTGASLMLDGPSEMQMAVEKGDPLSAMWRLADDVGTSYGFAGGSAGSAGELLLTVGDARFSTGPPAHATKLYVTPPLATEPVAVPLGTGVRHN